MPQTPAHTPKSERVILLGGSFDPVHLGHIAIAEHILSHYPTSTFYFVPAYLNPLKVAQGASPQNRLQMLKIALRETKNPRMKILEWELENKSPSYTVHTLQRAKKEFSSSLSFVMGNEVFKTLPEWKEPLEIMKLSEIIVVNRTPGPFEPNSTLTKLGIPCLPATSLPISTWKLCPPYQSIHFLPMKAVPVSSTEVRESVRSERKIHQASFVPHGITPSVWEFIKENQLYAVKT
jgi:nicotinate-nucleotide adenylyltransferase